MEAPKLEAPSEAKGAGRKRIKSDDSADKVNDKESDSNAEKLKSVFEASAW